MSLSLGLGDGDSGLDFSGHHEESLLNVLAVLGGSLQESNIVVLGLFLSFVSGHLSRVFHIGFIAHEDSGDVVGSVLLHLVHPVFDGVEAFFVGNVVGHDDSVGAFVVAAGDGLESLLPCSVPL